MPTPWRDAEHLVRLAVLFVFGFVLFLAVRAALIPDGFGELGHYRVGAIDDNREQALVYAGRQACNDCHEDVVTMKSESSHSMVGCEACHGPLADHVADPATSVPERPQPAALCLNCHRASVAKPSGFPQIVEGEHMEGGPCADCHDPHVPF